MDMRGRNPNSQANLAKGRTKGRGRPVGSGGASWKELIKAYGELTPPDTLLATLNIDKHVLKQLGLKAPTWKLVIVAANYRKALSGDSTLFKELMDRDDGKVTNKTEITGADNTAIQIEHKELSDDERKHALEEFFARVEARLAQENAKKHDALTRKAAGGLFSLL